MQLHDAIKVRLAAALNHVVPENVALAATPSGIRIVAGDAYPHPRGLVVGSVEVESWPFDGTDNVEGFALKLLEELQEAVIEGVTKTGWPPADPDDPHAPQRAGDLPQPACAIEDGELRCWYGSSERPALSVPPVRLGIER